MPTAGFTPVALRARPLRVVLLNDNAADTTLMQEVFSTLSTPLELGICPTASQMLLGLRTSDTRLPDLVRIDLHLAGLSGIAFLMELKRDPQLRRLPVMILSGSDDPGDIARAYQEHASAYLIKPLALDQLQAQLQALMSFRTYCGVIG